MISLIILCEALCLALVILYVITLHFHTFSLPLYDLCKRSFMKVFTASPRKTPIFLGHLIAFKLVAYNQRLQRTVNL